MHICRSGLCLGGRFRSWRECLDYRRFEVSGREFENVEVVSVVKSRGVLLGKKRPEEEFGLASA